MTETITPNTFKLPEALMGGIKIKTKPANVGDVFWCVNGNGAGLVYVITGNSPSKKTVEIVLYDKALDSSKQATLSSYEKRRIASFDVEASQSIDLTIDGEPDAVSVQKVLSLVNDSVNESGYVNTAYGVRPDRGNIQVALERALPDISRNYWVNNGARIFEIDMVELYPELHEKAAKKMFVSLSMPVHSIVENEYLVRVEVGYGNEGVTLIDQKRGGKLRNPAISYTTSKSIARGNWKVSDDQSEVNLVKRVLLNTVNPKWFNGTIGRNKLISNLNYITKGQVIAEQAFGDGSQRDMVIPTAFVIETLQEQGCLSVTAKKRSGYGKRVEHLIESLDGSASVKLNYLTLDDCLDETITSMGVHETDYHSWSKSEQFKQGSRYNRMERLITQLHTAGILSLTPSITSEIAAANFITDLAYDKGLDQVDYVRATPIKAFSRLGASDRNKPVDLTAEQLFEKRGLSADSLDYCIKQGLISLSGHPDDIFGGKKDVVVGNNGSLIDNRVMAQQFFTEQSNGKIFKAWTSNATNASKAGFIIGDKNKASEIVFTEATFDTIALRDVYKRCGFDLDESLLVSVNSTSSLNGFLSHNFGIDLPHENTKGIIGYLTLPPEMKLITEPDLIQAQKNAVLKGLEAYESVVFVHDDTPKSEELYQSLLNLADGKLNITLDKSPDRSLTGNYDYFKKDKEHLFLDVTNFDDVFADTSVRFDENSQPKFFDIMRPKRRAIYSQDKLLDDKFTFKDEALATIELAKKRMLLVMPQLKSANFGFDNDKAGFSKAHHFCALMSGLGFGGNMMVPPMFSRNNSSLTVKDVNEAYGSLSMNAISSPQDFASINESDDLRPHAIVNDWNDLSRLDDSYTDKIKSYLVEARNGALNETSTFDGLVELGCKVDACRKVIEKHDEKQKLENSAKRQPNIRRKF
ncbi:hypothetical protein VCHA53O466_40239 [Vibrio chagasii]|nr:hypothetical protein VCHA53O466_40239 [Vibrio chagasii]